jgi:hypothetical protein
MSESERFAALAAELIRSVTGDSGPRASRRYRRGRRAVVKIAKVAALMVLAAIVIPVTMITLGLLFGPRGVEGLIAAPLSVLTAWAAILYWAFRPRVTRRTIAKVDLAALPASTEEWLEQQRPMLPLAAQVQLDAIAQRLTALAPQLQGVDPQTVEAIEIRRLLGEELPDLVHGYQKVPEALRRRPLHDGPSPEGRLIEALATIDEQIDRLHHRFAEGDLHTLATHQRYLELKYKNDGKLK